MEKVPTVHTEEGIGATAKRLIPGEHGHLDPFVIFDEYLVRPGAHFPLHPHGGFEGFQVLMEGRTIYTDNQGNHGLIGPGDVRRFVAGEGFQHSEEPDHEGTVRGYLLWVKLPIAERNTPVIFKEENVNSIPKRKKDHLTISTIIGPGSPVRTYGRILWEFITAERKGIYPASMEYDENGFIYVSSGSCGIDGERTTGSHGIILSGKGEFEIIVDKGTEMVFIKGKKLNERIVQNGHYVEW